MTTQPEVGTDTDTTLSDNTQSTLKDVSHTDPYTDEPFGNAMAYHRGPVVAADGGNVVEKRETLADIDHTPPYGPGVNPAYERGTEGREEPAAARGEGDREETA